jgi:hypothetical protein
MTDRDKQKEIEPSSERPTDAARKAADEEARVAIAGVSTGRGRTGARGRGRHDAGVGSRRRAVGRRRGAARVERVLSKDIEEFSRRNRAKNDAGFLLAGSRDAR